MPVRCTSCEHPAAPDAVAAGACARCGAALAAPPAMPAIDISRLAALDELDPGRAAPRAPAPTADDPRFAPPAAAGGTDDDQQLGVERSTRAIRIENQFRAAQAARAPAPSLAAASLAAPSPAAPPAAAAPSRSIRGVALAIALIAAVVIGVAALVVRTPGAPSRPQSSAGVSIRIIAREPTAVMIDGHPAGKTPLTLQRPPGTQPILIAAPGAARQVIPDRDQTVDLSPR